MRTPFLTLVVGAMLLVAPASAAAECQPPQPTEAALANASVAFIGTVTTVSDRDRIAEVEVVAVWKGPDLRDRVSVWGTSAVGSAPDSTDRRFTVGATYLIIPENTREPFLATSCSATQIYTDSGLVIPVAYQDDVGATTGRPPASLAAVPAEIPPLPDRTLVAVIAVVGLGTAALGIFVRRRSARKRRAYADEVGSRRRNRGPRFRVRRLSLTGLLTRFFRPSGMKHAAREKGKPKARRA